MIESAPSRIDYDNLPWTFQQIAEQFDALAPALTEMARLVANQLHADACSVYQLEEDSRHLVLAATMGLNQSSVGQVRMKTGEGLVGLVIEQGQPVSISDAQQHPRFLYFPDAGEEPFQSFDGVPILSAGRATGVLVVQTEKRRRLSRNDAKLLEECAKAMAPNLAAAGEFALSEAM